MPFGVPLDILGIDIAFIAMSRGSRVREWTRQVGRKGFTVIELLVALVMVVLLAGVSLPFFLTIVQNYRFDGAVQQVLVDLRYAQSVAVSRGGQASLHWGNDLLPAEPNTYRIERSTDGGTTWTSVTPWVNISADFQGITIQSIKDSANVTLARVSFDARGASVATLNHPIRITLVNAAGTPRTVEILATGTVRAL